MSRPYLALHTHSRVGSTRDCTAPIEDMVKLCSQNNMSFALTDHGWAAGVASYYKYARKYGVKPVYGVEFYLSRQRNRLFELRSKIEELKNLGNLSKDEKLNVDDELRLLNYEFDEIKKYNHLVVVAKSQHGLQNLMTLHNSASLHGFYVKPLVTLQELFALPRDNSGDRGLVVTSSCLSGVVPRELLRGRYEQAKEHVLLMKEELGDDWYLELQAHELKEQREVNRGVVELSKETGVKLVIGTDSHYLNKSYSRSHEVFLLLQGEQKISDIGKKVWQVTYETPRGETRRKKLQEGESSFCGVTLSELKVGDTLHKKNGLVPSNLKWDYLIKKVEQTNKVWAIESADLTFKNEEELRQHAKQYSEIVEVVDEAIENNKDVYEKVQNWEWDSDLKLPLYDNSNEKLFELCLSGLKEKNLHKNEEYVKRFKSEFTALKNGGLSSYVLLLLEIINYAKSERIPVGTGRGCFLPKNKIKTENRGNITIDEIQKGDVVITHDLLKKEVLNTFVYNVEENVLHVTTESGKKIEGATKDHKVYAVLKKDYEMGNLTPQWVALDYLKKGDYIAEYSED